MPLHLSGASPSCTVSKSGLTRVSLKDDRFASVSKLTTGVESDDFTVVNEPTRGDIYLSVPEGFSRQRVSFFGTTSVAPGVMPASYIAR